MKLICFALIFSLFLSLSLIAQDESEKRAPSVVLRDLNGKTVRLSDFKGKIVLLNFWNVWCSPCAAEVRELVKWQTQYKTTGLQVVGITYPPTNAAAVRRFVRRMKVNYPILYGSESTKKLFEQTETLPVTVIIDRKGRIVERIDGVIFPDEFDAKIKPILK